MWEKPCTWKLKISLWVSQGQATEHFRDESWTLNMTPDFVTGWCSGRGSDGMCLQELCCWRHPEQFFVPVSVCTRQLITQTRTLGPSQQKQSSSTAGALVPWQLITAHVWQCWTHLSCWDWIPHPCRVLCSHSELFRFRPVIFLQQTTASKEKRSLSSFCLLLSHFQIRIWGQVSFNPIKEFSKLLRTKSNFTEDTLEVSHWLHFGWRTLPLVHQCWGQLSPLLLSQGVENHNNEMSTWWWPEPRQSWVSRERHNYRCQDRPISRGLLL